MRGNPICVVPACRSAYNLPNVNSFKLLCRVGAGDSLKAFGPGGDRPRRKGCVSDVYRDDTGLVNLGRGESRCGCADAGASGS